MELRHLRYFVAVAEELNFTRAAARLHIAQPPLSTQIRGLEEELGAELFVRDKRRIYLTQAGTQLLGRARAILADAVPASEADYEREFLDLILAVRIVPDLETAIATINRDSSGHTEAIITADEAAAQRFQQAVDSAVVTWNASTRFNDGFEFGFGAEIGISTDRLHARGPMGLNELCSYKYLVTGTGQVRG